MRVTSLHSSVVVLTFLTIIKDSEVLSTDLDPWFSFSYEQLVMRSLAPLSVWQISRMYILFLLSLFFLSGILIMHVGSLCRPLAVKLNTLTRE